MVMYISKGVLLKKLPHKQLLIYHYRDKHRLNEKQSILWLNGTRNFCQTTTLEEERTVYELVAFGIAEISQETNSWGKYYLLRKCLIGVLPKRRRFMGLTKQEKKIMKWLDNAGFRLGIAELIFLVEQNIEPTEELFGWENAGKLRLLLNGSLITIGDTMGTKALIAYCRDDVIACVISLVRKKRICLI